MTKLGINCFPQPLDVSKLIKGDKERIITFRHLLLFSNKVPVNNVIMGTDTKKLAIVQ